MIYKVLNLYIVYIITRYTSMIILFDLFYLISVLFHSLEQQKYCKIYWEIYVKISKKQNLKLVFYFNIE